MRTKASTASAEPDLQGLGDPEFFAHWATIRNHMAMTSTDDPKHAEIRERYDAVTAEYRRRMSGARRETAP